MQKNLRDLINKLEHRWSLRDSSPYNRKLAQCASGGKGGKPSHPESGTSPSPEDDAE